jgi:hypothetical protein
VWLERATRDAQAVIDPRERQRQVAALDGPIHEELALAKARRLIDAEQRLTETYTYVNRSMTAVFYQDATPPPADGAGGGDKSSLDEVSCWNRLLMRLGSGRTEEEHAAGRTPCG